MRTDMSDFTSLYEVIYNKDYSIALNNTHVNILFNGCSITNGGELEGLENNREHRIKSRFSSLVASDLNLSFDHIAVSGCDNESIVRRTLSWFNAGNICDLAVIQWSGECRKSLVDSDGNLYGTRKFMDNNRYPDFMMSIFNLDKSKWKNDIIYGLQFNNEFYGSYVKHKCQFVLEQFFESKNIPYIFINFQYYYDPPENYYWYKLCKTKNILSVKDLIGYPRVDKINYCPRLNSFKLTGDHPNERGHRIIADYVINQIKERCITNF